MHIGRTLIIRTFDKLARDITRHMSHIYIYVEEGKKKRKKVVQGAHTLRVEENRSTSAALITRLDSNSLSTRSSSLWVVFAELDASCSIACVARVTRHLSFDLAKN